MELDDGGDIHDCDMAFVGMVTTSIAAVRTAVVAANTPAAVTTVQGESARMRTAPALPATTPQQAAAIAAGDASTVSLVISGGILCGCVASILGGATGLRPLRPIERRAPAPVA